MDRVKNLMQGKLVRFFVILLSVLGIAAVAHSLWVHDFIDAAIESSLAGTPTLPFIDHERHDLEHYHKRADLIFRQFIFLGIPLTLLYWIGVFELFRRVISSVDAIPEVSAIAKAISTRHHGGDIDRLRAHNSLFRTVIERVRVASHRTAGGQYGRVLESLVLEPDGCARRVITQRRVQRLQWMWSRIVSNTSLCQKIKSVLFSRSSKGVLAVRRVLNVDGVSRNSLGLEMPQEL